MIAIVIMDWNLSVKYCPILETYHVSIHKVRHDMVRVNTIGSYNKLYTMNYRN